MNQNIEAVNRNNRIIGRLNRELADPRRTATDDEIDHAKRQLRQENQHWLMLDLEAQGVEFDADGPQMIQCEHCDRAIQYNENHHCHGSDSERGELQHNELDYQ